MIQDYAQKRFPGRQAGEAVMADEKHDGVCFQNYNFGLVLKEEQSEWSQLLKALLAAAGFCL